MCANYVGGVVTSKRVTISCPQSSPIMTNHLNQIILRGLTFASFPQPVTSGTIPPHLTQS
jgi:hypothetical protein